MMKPETTDNLERLMALVERELARIEEACGSRPSYGDEGYSFEAQDAWWRKRDVEIARSKDLLGDYGARFTHRAPDGHAIHLAGIRSSSTSGFTGAFRNWLTAAAKRLEKEAAR